MAFDWIVVGLGAMGSATAHHLAKKGAKVLGLERFQLNHQNGSSHGSSRIIRTAYFEGPVYVPLVKRAFELWHELERESGQKLLRFTGGLMIGGPEGALINGTLRSAREHGLPHEVLSSEEVETRFPVFRLDDKLVGVYEKQAGILAPEACIDAHCTLAARNDAVLRFDESVSSWRMDSHGVQVTTRKETYSADGIIFTAGAWNPELLRDLSLPLKCERQVMFWFEPSQRRKMFSHEHMPIFIWEKDEPMSFYGIPEFDGQGVKVARNHGGEYAHPDRIRRQITAEDEQPVREFVRSRMPWANGRVLASVTCLYTNTPDGHFIIDFHPKHRNVMVVSACSGHGFKFSSVIGEIIERLASGGKTQYNIEQFGLNRFLG